MKDLDGKDVILAPQNDLVVAKRAAKRTAKLTKNVIDGLAPEAERYPVWDTEIPGFGIRVSPNGRKVFFINRRVKGRQEKGTIGDYGSWTVDAARKKAKELSVEYDKGISVNEQKRTERARGLTLANAVADYLETHNLREGSITTYGYDIKRLGQDWQSRPVRDITKEMVRTKYLKLCKEGTQGANKSMRVLNAVINHVREKAEGDFPDNPVKLKGYWREVGKRRQTIIKDNDLPAWFKAVQELKNPVQQDMFELLLRTGLRKNEVAKLRWSSVDMADGAFTVVEGAAKNHREWTRYMSRQVRAIFQRRLDYRENAYVFPGFIGENSHMSYPDWQEEAITAKTYIEFCAHDLRRTFTTIASYTCSPIEIKYLLNHKGNTDVTMGYMVISRERKIQAEQRMADAIDQLIAPPTKGNVVPFVVAKKADKVNA